MCIDHERCAARSWGADFTSMMFHDACILNAQAFDVIPCTCLPRRTGCRARCSEPHALALQGFVAACCRACRRRPAYEDLKGRASSFWRRSLACGVSFNAE